MHLRNDWKTAFLVLAVLLPISFYVQRFSWSPWILAVLAPVAGLLQLLRWLRIAQFVPGRLCKALAVADGITLMAFYLSVFLGKAIVLMALLALHVVLGYAFRRVLRRTELSESGS